MSKPNEKPSPAVPATASASLPADPAKSVANAQVRPAPEVLTEQNPLASIQQITPAAALLAQTKRYFLGIKPSLPSFMHEIRLAGVTFPRRTGSWNDSNTMNERRGVTLALSAERVAAIKEAASRTFLRFTKDQTGTTLMGAVLVEAAPPGVKLAVMVLPTDIPVSNFLIFQQITDYAGRSGDGYADEQVAEQMSSDIWQAAERAANAAEAESRARAPTDPSMILPRSAVARRVMPVPMPSTSAGIEQ